ncbi:hypothetical protein [Pelagicoccus sp. SDUM812003]|uniref:hypothetical protein n=1 Tax=Pelagicoccus sp. SDUM812003 TaxID=3041267 RepID=UPI002810366E|nr:hypothetical protein [Pelagicoccus sp. SDUM812003]MDQ8202255.1 hypothetical protein [Pelagicoccus sp. SDUM812003]
MSTSQNWSRRDACISAAVIACAFIYFLLFAQFALLHRIETLDAEKRWLQPVMICMGLGGVSGSLLAWRRFRVSNSDQQLFFGFLGSGVMAVLSTLCFSLPCFLGVGFGVGLALGFLTVTIVPILRLRVEPKRLGRCCAAGVGIAYAVCNLPFLFKAAPDFQCMVAAMVVGVGACLPFAFSGPAKKARMSGDAGMEGEQNLAKGAGVWGVIVIFALLVWLDSAAFYVIQETDTLRGVTWGEFEQLWILAAGHLLGAGIAGCLIENEKLLWVLGSALSLLVLGSFGIVHGEGLWSMISVSGYVLGVSFYSTALVAFGALSGEANGAWPVAKRAGMLFALAGWVASGMGIGMARDLSTIPVGFLAAAVVVGLASLYGLKRLRVSGGVWG